MNRKNSALLIWGQIQTIVQHELQIRTKKQPSDIDGWQKCPKTPFFHQ